MINDTAAVPTREPGNDFPYLRRTWNTVVVTLLGAAFVPLLIIGGGMYLYLSTLLKHKTIESLRLEALELKTTIDQFLTERTRDLKLIAGNIGLAGLRNADRLQAAFDSLQQQLPCFTDLGVIDDRGRHLAYVGPYDLRSKNYRDAEWFSSAMSRGIYISDVFLGYRNVPHFVIAVKQNGDEGAWLLRATVDTDYFHRLLAATAAKNRSQAFLVDQRGSYQSRPGAAEGPMGPSALTDLKTFQGVVFQEGRDSFLMKVWLEKVPWLCVVQMDRKVAFADMRRIRAIGIWVFILAAILMVMTVLLTTNHLVARLELKRRSIHFLGRQLRQSNRLASAMKLSHGFFQEIKDTLTNIDAAAACIQDSAQPDQGAGIAESLAQIRSETARSRASIDRFMRFTRPTEPMIQALNVAEVLDELMAFLNKELRFSNIAVMCNYAEDLPSIRSDPAELRQVFQNLILNAIDAIERDGEITLTTRRQADDVIVTVADSGPGIAEAHLAKIFEPLFTTKPGGTGLGLSICADILERLSGRIRVHNSPGGGACFMVTLPIRFSRAPETG